MADQELNIKFVGIVEKHEVLYNCTLPEFSNKDITEKAWREVAKEFKMPVSECKEKWRNLRTVFIRRIKPTARYRTPYYLENAMQFCLPFVRKVGPYSFVNLPQPPSTGPCIETNNHQSDSEYSETQDEDDSTDEESMFEKANLTAMSNKRKKKQTTAADADWSVAEYFKAKKAALTLNGEANKINRQNGIRMFLLSLIPELEDMTDSKIKLFKRRVFGVIDDIKTSEKKRWTSSGPNYTNPPTTILNSSLTTPMMPITIASPEKPKKRRKSSVSCPTEDEDAKQKLEWKMEISTSKLALEKERIDLEREKMQLDASLKEKKIKMHFDLEKSRLEQKCMLKEKELSLKYQTNNERKTGREIDILEERLNGYVKVESHQIV